MKTTLLNRLIIIFSFTFSLISFSQTTATFTASGSFTVPCGVTSITVQCWGGGGAGAGDATDNNIAGAGGGAGGYTTGVIAVTPGTSIAYTVGNGGTGGTGAGPNGGNTTFSTVIGNGGVGGSGITPGTGGAGSGGTTTNGASGIVNSGSAGGAGGAANLGGAGGAGGANAANGSAGTAPGGGGGGAGDANTVGITVSKSGGSGGKGQITITYNVTSAGVDQTLAECATTTSLAASVPSAGTGTWTCVTGCTGVSITSPNSATSAITGLVPGTSTTFRWTVTNAGCTTTTDDVIVNAIMGPACLVYCPEGTMSCAANDGLTNVTFSTINANSTPCANGVAATATVTAGNTYAFSATSGTGAGNHSLAVYIDWNADGDFLDASEFTLIANNNMAASTTKSGNLTVPVGAYCGATVKMRVLYVYSTPVPTASTACTNFTYGEAEDYSLTISCCVPNCSNGIQDCNELGVDCGGPCGSACPGVVSCTNGIMDGTETGVDCGGAACNPCGAQCSTFSNATSTPTIASDGSTIIDATSGNQTITTCVEVTYSNRGTNWLHGVFMNPASTGFVSTGATGALPEPDSKSIGTTYMWRNQTTNFTGQTSGNSITQNGWFVTTATTDDNPGNNLGWPVGAGTTFGPFCFSTVVGCSGLTGDNAAFMNFQTTGDSYSGSWTNVDCGKESSFGDNAFSYTLRCPAVLPIELLNFNGAYEGRRVLLKWSTASEQDNDFFTVLRSIDGVKFSELAKVEGAPNGSSINKRDYSQYDYTPENPITYYKIRQTDFDGSIKESSVIAILSPKVFDELTVVPNPVSNLAALTYYSEIIESTQVKIYDLSGKIMFQNNVESDKGVNSISFDTEGYKSGLYFVEIVTNNEPKIIKFTVQK